MIILVGVAIAVFVVPDAWTVPVIVAAVAVEVTETAFTMWWSQRAPPKVGPDTLAGSVGRAIEDCRPLGRVRVRGEIWQARSKVDIPAGAPIRVLGRDRLTLLVEPADYPSRRSIDADRREPSAALDRADLSVTRWREPRAGAPSTAGQHR